MSDTETLALSGLRTAEQPEERPYGALVLSRVPYLLSLVDRNPYSRTYGCCDRGFWHYRTMSDYAAPIHQEIALTLALVAQQEGDRNPYSGSDELCRLAGAALRFWCSLQQRDGSFAEFYPGERSFVATSFTAYAASETLLRLGERAETELRGQVVDGLRRAADWLARHRDLSVVNHTAGAIAALHNTHLLTGDPRLLTFREAKIADLLARQHAEGWFYEYGGADPAYLSLAVDYLAKDYRRSRDERLGRAMDRALSFMAWFAHPDGSFGGEYGSRNAKYLMPHGLEVMAARSPAAAYLRECLCAGLRSGRAVSPASMDDRYSGFFLNKYAEAWAEQTPAIQPDHEAFVRPQVRFFPGAGLLVARDPVRYYAVVGMSKHGVVKAYATGERPGPVFSDVGYWAAFAGGDLGTTQWLDLSAESHVTERPGRIEIRVAGPAVRVNTSLPMTGYLLPFRLFLRCWSWNGAVMDWFGARLKERMISARRVLPLRLERTITLEGHELRLVDRVRLDRGHRLTRLGVSRDATALHVASSRYYQPGEHELAAGWEAPAEAIAWLNQGRELEVSTRVLLPGGETTRRVAPVPPAGGPR